MRRNEQRAATHSESAEAVSRRAMHAPRHP
jgi:hypothetical protein